MTDHSPTHSVPDEQDCKSVANFGARGTKRELELESSGGGDGEEIQGKVYEAIEPMARASRLGLRHARLPAQALDFRVAPRCVGASMVTEAYIDERTRRGMIGSVPSLRRLVSAKSVFSFCCQNVFVD
jgi:hypothetical protein